MDKADFIRLAPAYYELAVVEALRRSGRYMTEATIQNFWNYKPDPNDPSDERCYIDRDPLVLFVLKRLGQQSVVDILDDPFGPTSYRAGEKLDAYMEEKGKDRASPVYKSNAARDADSWLKAALLSVNKEYTNLGIKAEDLDNPEAEWEPIPIERDSEEFLKAEAAVEKTIEEVEKSNGYATQHPEERESVLGNLKLLREKLKTATAVSIAFVKAHGLEPLKKLSARFVNTAVGRVVDLAIGALLMWLGLK